MASGRIVRASRHRHRAATRQGEKSKERAEEIQLPNLTLALAAGERGDERCGSGPAAHLERLRASTREYRGRVSSVRLERIGLVINDIPTVESKAPSQFRGVLLALSLYYYY